MPESENFVQDTIAYRQKAFKILRKPEAVKCLRDKNTSRILELLKDKPMTLLELQEELNRSQKTIYRYLKQLEKAGLVVQAGKRVIAKEDNKIKTQTLYTRAARIFYDGLRAKEIDEYLKVETTAEPYKKIMEIIALLLGQLFDNRKGYAGRLWELSKKVHLKRREYVEKLLNNADEKILDFISTLPTEQVQYIIDILGLFAILSEEGWEKEVSNCFK